MGKPFRHVNLCHTNDFPTGKNDKIKGWVEANGGTFSRTITPEVTHLVASQRAFRARHMLVKAAIAQRTIEIVKYAWLEDSLLSRNRSPKKAKNYAWYPSRSQKVLDSFAQARPNARIERAKKIEDAGLRFDRECAALERDMAVAGYHPYTDCTPFTYLVNLVRKDILENEIHRYRLKVRYTSTPYFYSTIVPCPVPLYYFPSPAPFSLYPAISAQLPRRFRYQNRRLRVPVRNSWATCLQIYESNVMPHNYSVYGLYSQPNVGLDPRENVNKVTVAALGSSWEFAWNAFRKFFKQKTGIEWERRLASPYAGETRQSDGANDRWENLPPRKRESQDVVRGHSERQRKTSMTILIDGSDLIDSSGHTGARAKTPEGGW